MDAQMLQKLLASYGASNNAENANRIREFGAANPDVLERRAMGMRGSGVDDNSDILSLQLDKLMQQTDAAPRAMNAPEDAPMPSRAASSPQAVAPQRKAMPQQSPGMPGDPQPLPQDAPVNPMDNSTQAPQSSNLMQWLLPLLGITSVAGREAMRPQRASPRAIDNEGKLIEGANPSQKRIGYQPKLEDNVSDLSRVKTNEPPVAEVRSSPESEGAAKKRQLQTEIDAENSQMLQQQMKEQAMRERQGSTRDLLKQAGRTIGRK